MIVIENKHNCTGCHACFNVCPTRCIEMLPDDEGFLYPQADATRCIQCRLCEKICPVIHTNKRAALSEGYAAYHKELPIRQKSSSGGIFSLLAETVLDENGVVFGAAFDETFHVRHCFTEKKEALDQFRGSKYVQSTIGETYQQAEAFLKQGRTVLFSGTPCQIAGLKAYLQKDYEKLFCQDIVCHGVPSPAVWQKYVDYRQQKAQSPAEKISFRDKTNGWKQFSMSFEFQDKTIYKSCHQEDPMMKAFLSNICLRPSCHNCKFKNQNRQSDVTLADFWGIENVLPKMDDNNGTSLVLIHSQKGRALFEKISERMIYQSVDSDRALNDNPAAVRPVTAHPKRNKFFANLEKYSFDRLVEKYIDSPMIRLKNQIKYYKIKE